MPSHMNLRRKARRWSCRSRLPFKTGKQLFHFSDCAYPVLFVWLHTHCHPGKCGIQPISPVPHSCHVSIDEPLQGYIPAFLHPVRTTFRISFEATTFSFMPNRSPVA